MAEIYTMNAGFIQSYMTYQGKDKLDLKEVFKRLSLEMGGDGTKITKAQLDNYISKSESGSLDVDSKKLAALKKIQDNWDTISNGDGNITYDDMEKFSSLLSATIAGGFTVTKIEDSKSSIHDAIYDYLTDYLKLSSKDQITKSHLTSYLNDLITTSSDDNNSNTELIGALTNIIASHSPKSTIEAEA